MKCGTSSCPKTGPVVVESGYPLLLTQAMDIHWWLISSNILKVNFARMQWMKNIC